MACVNHSFFVQKELFGDLIVSHDSKTLSDVISSGFGFFGFLKTKNICKHNYELKTTNSKHYRILLST